MKVGDANPASFKYFMRKSVITYIFSCACSSRTAKFKDGRTDSLTLSEISIFSATIGWILTQLWDIVHQHCSTLFNYAQLSSTLFNFAKFFSIFFCFFSVFSLFFSQICSTLLKVVKMCLILLNFVQLYSTFFSTFS